MKVIRQVAGLAGLDRPLVLAAGMFDGVHRGHAELLRTARERADARHGEAWAFTFPDHPRRVLDPGHAPALLVSPERKLERLAEYGLDGCLLLTFTEDYAHTEPEAFLAGLTDALPTLDAIVVGDNWRFGYRARGDVALLRAFCRERSLDLLVPGEVTWQGQTLSSTRIREALADGDIHAAAAMLGRAPDFTGIVMHGEKRGRRLGFPTANLHLPGIQLPAPGVYAGWADVDHERHPAAIYVPRDPVEHQASMEVHLIGLDRDLYDRLLRASLVRRHRDDNLRFDREQDLIHQIQQDVATVRRILQETATHGPFF